jgi:hypothetical protein
MEKQVPVRYRRITYGQGEITVRNKIVITAAGLLASAGLALGLGAGHGAITATHFYGAKPGHVTATHFYGAQPATHFYG